MDKITTNNVSKFSGARLDFLKRINQNISNNQQNSSTNRTLADKILTGS